MSNEMLPIYSTILFNEVWDDVDEFKADFAASPFTGSISSSSPDNVSIVYYLLFARYGNNPIANMDTEQWKLKVFSVIFQYGPTWEKRLDVQAKLRAISDDDLLKGSKAIYNHAFNPSTAPSTGSLDELTFINDQNTTNYKKSKMDAYMQLWELLDTDVTEEFLRQFKKCFKIFVSPERPIIFVSDSDEESEED